MLAAGTSGGSSNPPVRAPQNAACRTDAVLGFESRPRAATEKPEFGHERDTQGPPSFRGAGAAGISGPTRGAGGFTTFGISPLKHNFQGHPLMQLPRLAELARSLQKTNQCRYIVPGTKQTSSFDHESNSRDGRTVEQVFDRIKESGSWIALYNVQTDPTYAKFLREVTDSMREHIEKEQGRIFRVAGFFFISAPPSVTPFHIDRENNLWLQVSGRKTMNVWDHRDREVVAGVDVDNFIKYGGLDNVRLKDGYRERSREFQVGPGDGVYFPATSPHMTSTSLDNVQPGEEVSISIGVVFYTEHTYRQANIHVGNLLLRKLGVEPRMPGSSPFADSFKFWLGRASVWFDRRFRGYQPAHGLHMGQD